MSDYLSDPDGSASLTAAVMWLQSTMLGTVAVTVAIIAIASVGFMMLTGRLNARHGVTAIIGCFVIFGASSVATGIRGAADGEVGLATSFTTIPEPLPTSPVVANPPPQPNGYDPYAGASIRQ